MPQMTILLTNDDGIDAPGLASIADKLGSDRATITVAPLSEQSGMSHALTMNRPLRVNGHGPGRWSVSGTPVDCVYLALHKLCATHPVLVVSGINKGANLGDDVFYSGTVGAAREAALNGIPALAISLDLTDGAETLHFDAASRIAEVVVEQMLSSPLPQGCFLNLNVPNRPLDQIHGIAVCSLGKRHYEPLVEERVDPRGKPYFWIGGYPVGEKMTNGTDGNWMAKGYATLTPLGLDNTARELLDHTDKWAPKMPEGL